MNNAPRSSHYLTKQSSGGFILLGTALAIFLILSLFSIFLLRIIVNENVMSGYHLLDIRTRNLSQSGLEHGLELFKSNGTPYIAPVNRNFNNGSYTITFDPLYNENNSLLPYSHYAMLNSSASIDDVQRNTRVLFSSYPDAFNLSFFGKKDGIINYSLSFDGANDYVQTNLYLNSLPYTITCRFKSFVSSGERSIVDTDIGGHYGHSIILGYGNGDNTIDVEYHNGSYQSPATYSANTWYTATATYENGFVKLYVDGNFIGSKSYTQSSPDGSAVRFGRHNSGDPQWFNGLIDKVAIWGKALTAAEILAVYDSGNTLDLLSNSDDYASSGDLIGYWDFNQGIGNTLTDLSGNGNDGTINGAIWELISNPTVGTFSQSGGLISGDIYFNGDLTSVNLSENNIAYTSTGVGGTQHPQPLPDIPLHNSSYFTTLLSTLPEGGGTGDGDGGSEPEPCPIVDFENGSAGWTEGTISGINTWNISNSAGNGASLGSKAYGAPNSGNSGMEHSYIESPAFDASAGGNLIFDTWMCNETGYYDREHVRISYNGGSSWQTLVNYTESFWNTQSQWVTHSVNIPASSGTANTKIRFEYDTIDGCCGCSGGWFVDNIQFPGCEQTGSGGTSGGGGSVEGDFTLQHGENTNNSTRSWNFNLSGDAESDNQIIVTQIWVRGDFSASSEYLSNVTIGGHNFGTMNGNGDDGNWDLEFSGSQSVTMNGTSVSASVYPSSAVNYAPGTAVYWWEIKVEFYQEPDEEGSGGSSVLTFNGESIALYNEYADSSIQNSNNIIFNNCTVNGPGKILASGDITFNSTTLSGNIEIISSGQISVENGSTMGTGVASLSNSVILYSSTGFSIDNSTIHGLAINKSGTTSFSNNANFNGAVYSLAQTCTVTGSSSIVGSLVSAYGLSLSSSTISKGSLPPIFSTPYGFQGMVIPGSYLEY